ncbi:MAG: Ser-Thr-rich GPI-anchored membrane family protein [Melioribacteraceae bacterium]|nr:Ser-Thr-rich GPI-anchored membrane family protein [Melioribacteraceae bacterium]
MQKLHIYLILLLAITLISCRTDSDPASPNAVGTDIEYVNSVFKVVSPALGETWKPGSTHTIKWNKSEGVELVNVYLYKKTEFREVLGQNIGGTSITWNIPANILQSHHYRIKVEDAKQENFNTVSGDFFILD